MRAAPILGSIAVNAAVLALVAGLGRHPDVPPAPPAMELTVVDVVAPPVTPPPVPVTTASGGGGGTAAAAKHRSVATRSPHLHATSAWSEVVVRDERDAGRDDGEAGVGGGTGGGIGGGHGRGIGLGEGGGIGGMTELPAPPPPPPPSLARPARLLHPSRQTDTDEAELFIARVTVDTDGDVVGARMLRSHPGSRGDTAASMIWQFRYAPALDDDGRPVRSTFEQPFAVR